MSFLKKFGSFRKSRANSVSQQQTDTPSEGNVGNPGSISNNNNEPTAPAITINTSSPVESKNFTHVAYQSEEDALTIRVIPASEYLLKGVVQTTNVLFSINTDKLPEDVEKKRAPLDLCVCLDRSGSMGGEKIRQCKVAIKKIIDNLWSDDVFHLVVYGSDVEVIIEKGNLTKKEELHRKVDDILVKGGTNMGLGINKAADMLIKHKKEGHTMRMFLFSDGLVNEGEHRTHNSLFDLTKKVLSKGVSTCSFGIGSDFDEDLMKGIAEYGQSYYFYIENESQIEKFVSAVLGALLGMIGKNAILKARGKNGGVVTKIYDCPDLARGMFIGDIKQNNVKNILIELKVTPDGKAEKEEIMSWELSFTHRKTDQTIALTGTVFIKYTEDEALVSVKNDEVNIATTIQTLATHEDEVIGLLETGNVKEAKEKKTKEVEELKKWVAKDKTNRVQNLLSKAEKSLQDMDSQQSNTKHLAKQAKYHQKLKRMDSADFTSL